MPPLVWLLITAVFAQAPFGLGIPLSSFYPFGQIAGDSPLGPPNDDNTSDPVILPFPIRFFGSSYPNLTVHNNGYLFFYKDSSLTLSYSSSPLPIQGVALVAPYWADVDTRKNGSVWFRVTQEPALLQRARSDCSLPMTAAPSWLFIATWDHVGYYNQKADKSNTFQCMLLTDGVQSYVTFLYADGLIQWIVSDKLSDQMHASSLALAGFNDWNGVNYYIIPGSQQPDIINVSSTSNVRVGGKWIFRIDKANCTHNVGQPNVTVEPKNVNASLDSQLTLSCQLTWRGYNNTDHKDNNCGYNITWFKDNNFITSGQTLLIPAVKLSDAGLYNCTAVNAYGQASSGQANIVIRDVYQYSAKITLNITVAANFSMKLREYLVGKLFLNGTAIIASLNISYNGSIVDALLTFGVKYSNVSVNIIVAKDLYGLLLLAVQSAQASTIALEVHQFGGCPLNDNIILLEWVESKDGESVIPSLCIQWRCTDANAPIQNLCRTASSLSSNLLQIVSSLEKSVINATLNPGNFLHNLDTVFQIDRDTIFEYGVAARLLNVLNFYTNNAVINKTTQFIGKSFAIRLEDVNVTSGTNCFPGRSFIVDLGSVDAVLAGNKSLDQGSLSSSTTDNTTASINVTSQCSNESRGNGSSTYRLTFNAFTRNTLFQSREQEKNGFKIGSIITSVGGSALALVDTIFLSLQIVKDAEKASNILAVTWDVDNRSHSGGVWLTEGTQVISVLNNTVLATVQLSSNRRFTKKSVNFAVLLDLNPGSVDCPEAGVLSLVGTAVSIVTLVVFIVTYLSSKPLRTSEHGLLLINMAVSLLCLYLVFILASYSTSIFELCSISAAFVHYFMLVYFMWTGVEAVFIFTKLVTVLSFNIRRFALKSVLVAWLVPLIIVGISVGAGHSYYNKLNGNFCRPSGLPFYIGLISPFLGIYIFNWIIFVVISASLIRFHSIQRAERLAAQKATAAAHNYAPASANSDAKFTARNILNSVALALLLGLGWGFNLVASSHRINALACAFQILFSVFVGCQGILLFFVHGVRSRDARKVWASWLQCCLLCPSKLYTEAVTRFFNDLSTDSSIPLRNEPGGGRGKEVQEPKFGMADVELKRKQSSPQGD